MAQKDILLKNFGKSLNNVIKLNTITDIFLSSLSSLEKEAARHNVPHTFLKMIQNQEESFRGVRNSHSNEEIFPTIYNQQLILVVSILENCLEKYFVLSLKFYFKTIDYSNFDHLNFKLNEFSKIDFNLIRIGEILIDKDSKINFQNYTSIQENFKKVEVDIGRLLTKNEIEFLKLSLQQRHVLIHKDGIIDDDFIKQTGSGRIGDKVQVTKKDIERIVEVSQKLTGNIANQIGQVEKR